MKKVCLPLIVMLLLGLQSNGISEINPVKNSKKSSYYTSIQHAYNGALSGESLLMQAVYFIEDINLNQNIETELLGGYDNGFTTASGFTTIYGTLIISNGTATIANVTIGGSANRWTCANTAVGRSPVGVIFDGTHIWVADETGEDIYKIQAATGAVVAVYPGGHGAQYLAYDNVHNNVWVTNPGSNTVTVINATSGASLNYSSGNNPDGIVFDGANMWVANYGPGTVTKIRASDGVILQTISVGVANVSHPRFLAYDNSANRIWVTIGSDNKVKKINPDTGEIEGTYDVPGYPYAMVFDGTSIWVTQGILNTVVKLRTSDGAIIGTYNAGVAPNGIAFDGAYIWITDQVGSGVPFPLDTICTVTQLRADDGAHVGTYRTGERPQWVTSGGGFIWVTNGSDNTVSRCTF
ncbi:MAG: YncE family protein [Desulfuromonadales bacterium]